MRENLIVAVFLLVLAVLAAIRISTGNAGPDPAKWLLHECGFWSLALLLLTLSVSTVSRIAKARRLVSWRRPLGLAAFGVTSAHLFVYVTVYQGLDLFQICADISKHRYITLGFLAWMFLVPLAATSTRAARIQLGTAWKKLHRVVYLIALLSIVHQGMAQKADLLQTIIFSAIFTGLMVERAIHARR